MRGAVLAGLLTALLVQPVRAAPLEEEPRVVYTEQLTGGPLADLQVALSQDRGTLTALVTAREQSPLPRGARIQVRLRPGGDPWSRLSLVPGSDGTWTGSLDVPVAEGGWMSLAVVGADGAVLQRIGRPGRSLRRIPLTPDAPPVHIPLTSPEAPMPILDTAGEGAVDRVRAGLYVADPHGLGLVVTVDLDEAASDDAEVRVAWNPARLPSTPLPVHRVGPRRYVAEVLPITLGPCHFVVEVREGRTVTGRLGTEDAPVRADLLLDGGLVSGPRSEGAGRSREELHGFPIIFREEVAGGPMESVTVGALPAGVGVQLLTVVRMRPGSEALPRHHIVAELNGPRDTWLRVPLEPTEDQLVWRSVATLPSRGRGYLTVQVRSDEGPLQTLGTRLRAARELELSPWAARVDVPATSVEAPQVVLRQRGEGVVAELEAGLYMADIEGVGVRIRVGLVEPPPPGATLEVEWNPPGAPWTPLRLVQVGPLTYEAVAQPANPGSTYVIARVRKGATVLGQAGKRAKPLRIRVELPGY